MGRWAVDLALSVGIFPYVLKLLQTTALDLRQTLVFIWTKILALDRSCQVLILPLTSLRTCWLACSLTRLLAYLCLELPGFHLPLTSVLAGSLTHSLAHSALLVNPGLVLTVCLHVATHVPDH